MKLILVRHGETVANATGILEGHLQGELSEDGLEQVKKVAERLSEEEIDCIYSSDLDRARRTAEEIAKYHKDVPFNITERLRERFLGDWEGKNGDDVDWKDVNESGQPVEEFTANAKKFLDEVYEEHAGDAVLFVTHGFFMQCLTSVILGWSLEKVKEDIYYSNTSVTIFEFYEDGNHKIHLTNCTEHLD